MICSANYFAQLDVHVCSTLDKALAPIYIEPDDSTKDIKVMVTKPKTAPKHRRDAPEPIRTLESAKLIPVSLLDPNPHQPRHEVAAGDVAELTASIKASGVIEPLVVCPKADRFVLIAGYRRLTASRLAGLTEVPCIVREGSDAEMLELALLENLQRADLTYIEEAESYKNLMTLAGIDAQGVATRLNKAPSTVYERLSLLSLPADIQAMVAARQISIKSALEVGKIGNEKRRERLAMKADRLAPDELRSRVERATLRKPRKKYEKRAAHPSFKDIFTGLPVKRVYKDQVTFVFKDEDEFIAALRKIIERYDSENWGADVS